MCPVTFYDVNLTRDRCKKTSRNVSVIDEAERNEVIESTPDSWMSVKRGRLRRLRVDVYLSNYLSDPSKGLDAEPQTW